jgi:hypothetical protein
MSFQKPKTPVIFLAFANERSHDAFLRKLTAELKGILRALEPAVQKERCQLRLLPAATQEEIAEVFQDEWYENRVWIFHYGGHADEDELWLETEAGGNRAFFSLGLARFLGAQPGLKLVFLNACATAEHVRLLLDANIPAVIATSRKIQDDQAAEFAVALYKGLAAGATLEQAFDEASGLLLGKYGPQSFAGGEGTRSLHWEGEENAPELPWRLEFRRDGSWLPAQWRLFYELKPQAAEGDELIAPERFIGETINNYKITELLGLGSIGNVYRALHVSLNEERAIRITHPIIEGYEVFRSLIIAGNRGLASLKHPNVVAFYDVGEVVLLGQKRLYIVMELVPGKRLDEFDLEGMLGNEQDRQYLVETALQVASGVEAAHQTRYVDEAGVPRQGVLHGNIKTRKIMFTPEGVPKLIDFLFTDLSRSRNIKFDPRYLPPVSPDDRPEEYLPPEVLRGETTVNPQTDIYGLGAVFFRMIAGASVADFSFADAGEMHRHIREKYRNFPFYLSEAIFRASHPDPRQRYQQVGELIDGMLARSSPLKKLRYWFRRRIMPSVGGTGYPGKRQN